MFCLLQVCDFQFCVLYTEEGVSDCTRQLSKEPIRQGVRPAPMLDVSSRVSSPNMGLNSSWWTRLIVPPFPQLDLILG